MAKSKSEERLYPVVAVFLKRRGYAVKIDAPKGSGIKFDLLKGWTIDVVGMKTVGHRKEVVAVEVKNYVSPTNVLQALSQAEMYQKACTKVYIGFPISSWDKEENVDAIKDVKELCQARGIGILKIRSLGLTDTCIEELPAIPSLRLDIYQGILEQFAEKIEKFDGFEAEDFQRTLEDDPIQQAIVRRKLKILLGAVYEELPSHLQNKLKYRDVGIAGSWGFLAEAKDKVRCTHFNMTIYGDAFKVGVISEGKRPVSVLTKNINQDKKRFLAILKNIREASVIIWKRIPTKVPRQFDEESVVIIQTDHLDMLSVDYILNKLKSLKLASLRVYFSYQCGDETVESGKLARNVAEDIELLEPFYNFAQS